MSRTGVLGFEPRMTGPEPVALPLGYTPIFSDVTKDSARPLPSASWRIPPHILGRGETNVGKLYQFCLDLAISKKLCYNRSTVEELPTK